MGDLNLLLDKGSGETQLQASASQGLFATIIVGCSGDHALF